MKGFWRWQPLGIRSIKIDHKAGGCLRRKVAATDSQAAYLDAAGERGGGANHQLVALRPYMDAVVADQADGRSLAGAACQDEIEGKAGFAGPGGPANKYGAFADQHSGGVNAGARGTCIGWVAGHQVGSRTVKRAPATVGEPSSAGGPARFSAQIRPPWASTICFEIERPSPEFCPKP